MMQSCEWNHPRRLPFLLTKIVNRLLHRRLDFDQVGRLPAVGFKFGRWLNVVLYQRQLR